MWFKKSPISIEMIITGCIQNDRKYQGMLYDSFFDTMFKVCRKYTKDDSDALIMLNNGFLKVFKNIQDFQHQGSFEGWTRKIMYHAVADYFRSKKDNIVFLENIEIDFQPTYESDSLENLYVEDIVKHIETLPSMSSKVLMLFAIEGFTHKEISNILQINENTSKWHVTQARQILRERLGFLNHTIQNIK
jgi:RNA polymerase sigma factor (sigma-70 family)